MLKEFVNYGRGIIKLARNPERQIGPVRLKQDELEYKKFLLEKIPDGAKLPANAQDALVQAIHQVEQIWEGLTDGERTFLKYCRGLECPNSVEAAIVWFENWICNVEEQAK